jgi:hypothetical protein
LAELPQTSETLAAKVAAGIAATLENTLELNGIGGKDRILWSSER